MTFTALGLHADLLRAVKELGFTRPTPIQQDTIPAGLQGKDLLACAATGSGKTAAFLLPTIHHLMGKPRGKTRALVLAPTRELAAQIAADLADLAVHTPVTGAAVFGGVGMAPQEHAFRSGTDVIVATPGRLLDHLKQPYAKLDALEILVLDEADRMLDMGFLPDIKRILRVLPTRRQTLFFSATMPPPIAALTREMLTSPVTVNLERQGKPAAGITQALYPVPQTSKPLLLLHLLQTESINSVLVFTRTKHRANRVAEFLVKRGIAAERIHGNRSQAQRTKALDGFKSGAIRVLVATDIAARGIDVDALGHVINFDVPAVAEDYIHRVGRTGRAEATGDAFTFVAPDEEEEVRAIERAVGKRLPRVTLPDFDYTERVIDPPRPPRQPRGVKQAKRPSSGGASGGASAKSGGRPASRGGGSRPASSDSPYRSAAPRPASGGSPGRGGSGEGGESGGGRRRRRGPRRPS